MFESKSDILLNCYWHTRQGRWTVSRETSHGHSHASCMHTLLINSGKSITPRKISSIIILQLTYRAGRKRKFWINRRCENWSSRINLSLSQTKERVQHVGSTADTMERSIFNRVILKWTDPWSWTPAKKIKEMKVFCLGKCARKNCWTHPRLLSISQRWMFILGLFTGLTFSVSLFTGSRNLEENLY